VHRNFGHFPTSAFDAMQTGARLAINHRQRKWLNHTFAFNGSLPPLRLYCAAVWRHLLPHPTAAFDVRECAGHSLKQSIEHVLTASNEDNRLLPSRGVSAKLVHEVRDH